MVSDVFLQRIQILKKKYIYIFCSDTFSLNPISGHCLQISCCVFYVVCYQYGLIFQYANLPLVTFLKNVLTSNFMPLLSRLVDLVTLF